MADWIPSSILKLLALCRVWIEALVFPDAHETYHWDEALCVDATDEIEPFVTACNACAEDDSTRTASHLRPASHSITEMVARTINYGEYYENAKGEAGPWLLVVEAIIS